MAYAVTILGTVNGHSFDGTLQSALNLLRSNDIGVDGAAHVLLGAEHVMTVLLSTERGSSTAIDVLAKAGFRVRAGTASNS
jgi:hypothetical protein